MNDPVVQERLIITGNLVVREHVSIEKVVQLSDFIQMVGTNLAKRNNSETKSYVVLPHTVVMSVSDSGSVSLCRLIPPQKVTLGTIFSKSLTQFEMPQVLINLRMENVKHGKFSMYTVYEQDSTFYLTPVALPNIYTSGNMCLGDGSLAAILDVNPENKTPVQAAQAMFEGFMYKYFNGLLAQNSDLYHGFWLHLNKKDYAQNVKTKLSDCDPLFTTLFENSPAIPFVNSYLQERTTGFGHVENYILGVHELLRRSAALPTEERRTVTQHILTHPGQYFIRLGDTSISNPLDRAFSSDLPALREALLCRMEKKPNEVRELKI